MNILWSFNVAMENCQCLDHLPIKHGDFSIARITRGFAHVGSELTLSFVLIKLRENRVHDAYQTGEHRARQALPFVEMMYKDKDPWAVQQRRKGIWLAAQPLQVVVA